MTDTPVTYPVQPPAQPPAVKKKNFFLRHKILSLVLAIVVVVVISQAVSGGSKDTPPSAQPPAAGSSGDASQEVPAEGPGVGSTVADGKLEFVVTSLEPGVARIGDDLFGADAQGQFLLVHMTVTNIGAEAQYFDASSQKLTDTQGRTHSADSGAAIYLPDSNSFLNSVNPGNSVEGIVVFDIPVDATPATIELHDSPFSGGTVVSLG